MPYYSVSHKTVERKWSGAEWPGGQESDGGWGEAVAKNSATTAWKVVEKKSSPKEYPFPFQSFSPILLVYLNV